MSVFRQPDFEGHEQVVFCADRETGLRCIIAIHDTTIGPAVGGCRFWPYRSEEEAIADVLRLSRGMTFKSALAGVPFGGGKAVVIGDPRNDKSEALLRALGAAVDRLGGRYFVAEDVGTGVADMDIVRQGTAHVAGIRTESGDPSPWTALGVFEGIRAALAHVGGEGEAQGQGRLTGTTVAIQGLGHVGFDLARRLHAAGARLIVADLNAGVLETARRDWGALIVEPDRIHACDADVLAPCALGATLNDATIPEIRARIVAGSANNQLAEVRHGDLLAARGILYAPDYVINAGGIINIAYEAQFTGRPYDVRAADRHVRAIATTLTEIFKDARRRTVSTAEAADVLAQIRLTAARTASPRTAFH